MSTLVLACSLRILLLLWRHTEMDPSPLLYFCTFHPPQAQEQTQTPLFLYCHPLMLCTEERKQDQMSFCTDIMWMFCVMLRVMLQQRRPLLCSSSSFHQALQAEGLLQSPVDLVESFFRSSEQTPKYKSG